MKQVERVRRHTTPEKMKGGGGNGKKKKRDHRIIGRCIGSIELCTSETKYEILEVGKKGEEIQVNKMAGA